MGKKRQKKGHKKFIKSQTSNEDLTEIVRNSDKTFRDTFKSNEEDQIQKNTSRLKQTILKDERNQLHLITALNYETGSNLPISAKENVSKQKSSRQNYVDIYNEERTLDGSNINASMPDSHKVALSTLQMRNKIEKNSYSNQRISNFKTDFYPNAYPQVPNYSGEIMEATKNAFVPTIYDEQITKSPTYELSTKGNPMASPSLSAQKTASVTKMRDIAAKNYLSDSAYMFSDDNLEDNSVPYAKSYGANQVMYQGDQVPFAKSYGSYQVTYQGDQVPSARSYVNLQSFPPLCDQNTKRIRSVNGMYFESNSSSNYKKLMCYDKKQFIKTKLKNGQFICSAKFALNYFDVQEELFYEVRGSIRLLVADNFVAKITIAPGYEIDIKKSFEENRAAILNSIVIIEILEDQLLYNRDKAYDNFKQIMEIRCSSISDEIDCSEDVLQLSRIFSYQECPADPLIMFQRIIQNDSISYDVKGIVEQLFHLETDLLRRNKCFPKFSCNVNIMKEDLFNSVQKIVLKGIMDHKQNLLQIRALQNFNFLCKVLNIDELSKENLLLIRKQDINLFSDLISLAEDQNQSSTLNIPIAFVEYLWSSFYKNIESISIESLKDFESITNPIYLFLIKSLQDLISEISKLTNIAPNILFLFDQGSCRLIDTIPWPVITPLSESLENRVHLVLDLMKHFEPGLCSKKRFSYTFKFQRNEESGLRKWIKNLFMSKNKYLSDTAEERCIWLYLLDTGIVPILCKESSGPFKELSNSLVKGFVKLIQKAQHDRYETFRIAAHNIVRFAHQIAPYFRVMKSKTKNVDLDILDYQIELINEICTSCEDNFAVNYFSSLMDVCREYWEFRESILGKLFNPCEEGDKVKVVFEYDMETVVLSLLAIVKKVLSIKAEIQHIIHFFRLFNEFLKHLKGVDFKWMISDRSFSFDVDGMLEKITNGIFASYRVLDAERFVENLERNRNSVPKHFSIETVKKLLEIIEQSLQKLGWSNEDRLKAAGDLFLAMGHSFAHFEDQVDYTDVEHFLRDSTTPFYSVVQSSDTYDNFKTRLDKVENFYLYTRKQNQIGVEEVLNQCEKEVSRANDNGFKTSFDRDILEACYDRYIEKLGVLENLEIPNILQLLSDEMKNADKVPVERWTPHMKQHVLPVLLAYLSAVWIIQESKDVSFINKRIEPHCVQILCILRLLGVDSPLDGVPKHFAQVLTGQGKSIILGLLSSLIALTGHESNIVCYNPYLAKRDKTYFATFMEIFSQFDVGNKVTYGTFDNICNKALIRKINGNLLHLRKVVENLVLNELESLKMESIKELENTFLLIDEADVFFSDKYYGKTYSPVLRLEMPALLEIQPKIWEIVESGVYEKSFVLKKIREFINEILKDKRQEDFKKFVTSTNILFEKQLEELIEYAIQVSREERSTQRYKINKEDIISYRDDFGFYTTSIFVMYYNIFAYFKLKKNNFDHKSYQNYGYLIINVGHLSYSNLPLAYKNILGVSGTLMTLKDSEISAIKRYGIETMTAMPSFFGKRNLEFDPNRNVYFHVSIESWHNGIFNHISKIIQSGRAVLVFFDTEAELKDFYAKFEAKIDRLHVLIGDEERPILEWHVSEAGVAQTVTLATRLMGRGIDYKSSDRSVEEKGGVHVIQTFFTLDEKEETQIMGRTARKDNKGSYEMVLCGIHLKIMKCYHTPEGNMIRSYEGLCSARRRLAAEQGSVVHGMIKEAEKEHELTIKFFDSLADYKPENRHLYISRYPFV